MLDTRKTESNQSEGKFQSKVSFDKKCLFHHPNSGGEIVVLESCNLSSPGHQKGSKAPIKPGPFL